MIVNILNWVIRLKFNIIIIIILQSLQIYLNYKLFIEYYNSLLRQWNRYIPSFFFICNRNKSRQLLIVANTTVA